MSVHIEINQTYSEPYFKEYYGEWLQYKSRFKKWQRQFALALLLLYFIIVAIYPSLYLGALGLPIFSIYMFYEFYASKKKWMRARLESNVFNRDIQLIFTEEEVLTNSSVVESKVQWNFFTTVIETQKGLLLSPENGTHIYLPKSAFASDKEWQWILEKIQTQTQIKTQ